MFCFTRYCGLLADLEDLAMTDRYSAMKLLAVPAFEFYGIAKTAAALIIRPKPTH